MDNARAVLVSVHQALIVPVVGFLERGSHHDPLQSLLVPLRTGGKIHPAALVQVPCAEDWIRVVGGGTSRVWCAAGVEMLGAKRKRKLWHEGKIPDILIFGRIDMASKEARSDYVLEARKHR